MTIFDDRMRALRAIARLGPSEDPGDREHDSLEDAEAHGVELGLFQAADIARRALASRPACWGVGNRRVNPGELSDAEIQHLAELNRVLGDVERRFHTAALDLDRELGRRVLDPDDWLSDYEVELSVDLYPESGDPSWDEDDDNLIGRTTERLTNVCPAPEFGFGAFGTDHTEPGRSLGGIRQYDLFHHLIDHSDLDGADFARVGMVWCDLVVTYQWILPVAGSRGAEGQTVF